MKFSNVRINNFRQYYNTVEFDLSTDQKKNIVIIGGKNGYGKTNLLLSIVWCLYGDKISSVDSNFKKEIQKEKNYSSFMQQSINWTAKKEGVDTFSVSILIEEVELPESSTMYVDSDKVLITRSRNTSNQEETLSITNSSSNIEIFDNDVDKINFINDYIIPIDAAKFVFFDAEKIADIANLSIKEEGSFINDALGKILGLDTYESLVEDLEFYINTLKKEGATKNLQEQIINNEKSIELFKIKIEDIEEESAEKLKDIDELKKQIRHFDSLISQNSKQGSPNFDRDNLISEKEQIENKESDLLIKINELSEIIPLTILAGKLEEVRDHILTQETNRRTSQLSEENIAKVDFLIEQLFNKPPDPENSTMSFRDKNFYYEKAKQLSYKIYNSNDNITELPFEHDLNNAEKQLILGAITLIDSQSAELFENTIDVFNEINLRKSELLKLLSKIDADLEDDIILEYLSEKETAEHHNTLNNRKIGENDQQVNKLKQDINRFNQQLITLRNKVEITAHNKLKIRESEKYIEVLQIFLEEQKRKHKDSLEKTILKELKVLMHKLSSENNRRKLIEDVKVTILASGQGMKISLYDQDDNEIKKESLSSGEKQIYISCLIKAIINESVQSLPVFIDTPLGRLDEEHRDSITKKYYPELAEQVILFSTNSEITPKRFRDISDFTSKSYLLINDGINTRIQKGYFNTVNND